MLQINYSSFSNNGMAREERSAADKEMFKSFQPNLGHLYPGKSDPISRSKDYAEMCNNLVNTPYHAYFQRIADPSVAESEPELN